MWNVQASNTVSWPVVGKCGRNDRPNRLEIATQVATKQNSLVS
jgi:hypothetical protein